MRAFLILLMFLTVVVVLAPSVSALSAFESLASRSAQSSTSAQDRKAICETHQTAIKDRSMKIATGSSAILTKFDQITQKAQSFYPKNGKTIANYDQLLANVQTQRSAVNSAFKTATISAVFSCDDPDPKTSTKTLRDNYQAVSLSLKDYRVSIRALLAAILGGVE